MRSVQAPAAVVMVRPHHFSVNAETAADNTFQRAGPAGVDVASAAYDEVTRATQILAARGVSVHLFEDDCDDRPDAVFPNNWFSTHPGGHVAIYPMAVPSRRRERRSDIIDMLKRDYRVQEIVDTSGLEEDGVYLEGTGAMVLDHMDRVAYVARSNRADPVALKRFCAQFQYEPIAFDAVSDDGQAIYHTNVLMCVGTDVALIGSSLIVDATRRSEILLRLGDSGRTIVELNADQIGVFAGNAIELQGRDGRFLAMSTTVASALSREQRRVIERDLPIVPLQVPTIEHAGGSVRCMIAGVHMNPRQRTMPATLDYDGHPLAVAM